VLMKGPIFDYSERGKETSGIKNLGNILQIWANSSSLEGLKSTKLTIFTLNTTILFWKVNKIQFELHAEASLTLWPLTATIVAVPYS
jgi:hypothetical protein